MIEARDPIVDQAIAAALKARERAYVPYSKFKMGAAVVSSAGEVISGALIENVSLGLSMCAERVALFASHARGVEQFEVLALVAPRTDGHLTWPCGACLQVVRELGHRDLLIVVHDGDETASARLHQLAPSLPHKS